MTAMAITGAASRCTSIAAKRAENKRGLHGRDHRPGHGGGDGDRQRDARDELMRGYAERHARRTSWGRYSRPSILLKAEAT